LTGGGGGGGDDDDDDDILFSYVNAKFILFIVIVGTVNPRRI
jgi:hypothetical protein